MPEPSVPQSHRDLLDTLVAVLATNRADGRPQVTAVGFYHDPDDDRVKISLNDTRQKTKNLRRDPNTTLFVLDPDNPRRTLEIRARSSPQTATLPSRLRPAPSTALTSAPRTSRARHDRSSRCTRSA